MVPGFLAAIVIGIALIAGSGFIGLGWLRMILILLGIVTTFIGTASIGMTLWGKIVGMPWHFTP